MAKKEYQKHQALERRLGSLLDATMRGPTGLLRGLSLPSPVAVSDRGWIGGDRAGSGSKQAPNEGEGPLVVITEASFPAVRTFTTAYMLQGGDGKGVSELLSDQSMGDHADKKHLKQLLNALREAETVVTGAEGDGKKKGGRGQQAKSGGAPWRQVFVYSVFDDMIDL
ncbi:unnamed protein product, partial [Discosporangium mesarthrocarpum]